MINEGVDSSKNVYPILVDSTGRQIVTPALTSLGREKINNSYYSFDISNDETASITHTGAGILRLCTYIMDAAGALSGVALAVKRDGYVMRNIVDGAYKLHDYTSLIFRGYDKTTVPWRYWEVGDPVDRYVAQIFYPEGIKFTTSLEAMFWAASAGFTDVACIIELITEGDDITVTYDAP